MALKGKSLPVSEKMDILVAFSGRARVAGAVLIFSPFSGSYSTRFFYWLL